MKVSDETLNMMVEIYGYSERGVNIDDLVADSKMRPVRAGYSHDDRMRALNLMLSEGLITTRLGRLEVVRGMLPGWLVETAASGNPIAFEVASKVQSDIGTGSKFDQEVLREIGSRGEKELVELLVNNYGDDAQVTQVSLFDDSLGYDIRVDFRSGGELKIEVKTTSRPRTDTFPFFISRNEFEVSRREANWLLALMKIENDQVRFVGLVKWKIVSQLLPVDQDHSAMWASSRLSVAQDNIVDRLPEDPFLE